MKTNLTIPAWMQILLLLALAVPVMPRAASPSRRTTPPGVARPCRPKGCGGAAPASATTSTPNPSSRNSVAETL